MVARIHHILRYRTQTATSTILNHLAVEYLRWLLGVSHSRNTATPMVRSTHSWTYLKILVLTFGTCGNVQTANKPVVITRHNPRQPVPLVTTAVVTDFSVESAMIAFLPRATAATTTTASTATAWPTDNYCETKPWTLHAYHTDTAPPASRHLLAGRGSSFVLERVSFTPAPAPTIHPSQPAPT